ncbi:MAG: PilZ domain-containing protein [Lachnospiraceae bacterium]
MDEKRRSKRVQASLKLNVSSIFKQDNIKISNISSPIEVINVSRGGIGFISRSILPVGYYFNAELALGSAENTIFCVVRIIRCTPKDNDTFSYGCEFVGMAPVLGYIFDDFEAGAEQ